MTPPLTHFDKENFNTFFLICAAIMCLTKTSKIKFYSPPKTLKCAPYCSGGYWKQSLLLFMTRFENEVMSRVFRKSLFVELDPVPKICDANRYGELTKKISIIDP